MDDHEIVDLYWQRDEHAIEATAAKYESYCMKISQNILSDRADSEENVNDTYLHAWQAMPPQRPAILSAFLGKIARNLALNRYKARSAQKRQGDVFALSLDELDDCAPALSSPDDEATKMVAKALADGTYLCLKICKRIRSTANTKYVPLRMGLAIVTSDTFEAPNDDNTTYSMEFQGSGKPWLYETATEDQITAATVTVTND